MRFVELFAGIGGFSLGFEKVGMQCVGMVEIDKYAQKVLKKHWPDVPLYPDVREIKGDEFGEFELLCGGFPCQDISVAGKQRGIHGSRSSLFDEIIRIAGICRPRFVVLENVAALISRSDWFGYVLGRIAEIGFDAEWEIIRASNVGAPHQRARIWIVAYTNQTGLESGERKSSQQTKMRTTKRQGKDVSYTLNHGSHRTQADEAEQSSNEQENGLSFRNDFWTIEPSICRVANGLSDGLYQGRIATGVKNRVDRLKCLGNALVPQIAEWIGQQIIYEPPIS